MSFLVRNFILFQDSSIHAFTQINPTFLQIKIMREYAKKFPSRAVSVDELLENVEIPVKFNSFFEQHLKSVSNVKGIVLK